MSTNNETESLCVCLRCTDETVVRRATKSGTYVFWTLKLCTLETVFKF